MQGCWSTAGGDTDCLLWYKTRLTHCTRGDTRTDVAHKQIVTYCRDLARQFSFIGRHYPWVTHGFHGRTPQKVAFNIHSDGGFIDGGITHNYHRDWGWRCKTSLDWHIYCSSSTCTPSVRTWTRPSSYTEVCPLCVPSAAVTWLDDFAASNMRLPPRFLMDRIIDSA